MPASQWRDRLRHRKERITREKHDTGFYQEVVDYCLKAEGISLADVDLVVRNCYVLPVDDLETRLLYENIPEFLSQEERKQARASPLFRSTSDKVVTVSHHLAHAYSAFAACPFEEGVVMVVDGVGSYASDIRGAGPAHGGRQSARPRVRELLPVPRLRPRDAAQGLARAGARVSERRVLFHAGARRLYSRVSSYIFGDWNKCGEVMGLAPYGRPGQANR